MSSYCIKALKWAMCMVSRSPHTKNRNGINIQTCSRRYTDKEPLYSRFNKQHTGLLQSIEYIKCTLLIPHWETRSKKLLLKNWALRSVWDLICSGSKLRSQQSSQPQGMAVSGLFLPAFRVRPNRDGPEVASYDDATVINPVCGWIRRIVQHPFGEVTITSSKKASKKFNSQSKQEHEAEARLRLGL